MLVTCTTQNFNLLILSSMYNDVVILTRQDHVRWWMQEYDVLCKCKILNLWGKKPGANLREHPRALVVWEAARRTHVHTCMHKHTQCKVPIQAHVCSPYRRREISYTLKHM